jgi:hypothetical protein
MVARFVRKAISSWRSKISRPRSATPHKDTTTLYRRAIVYSKAGQSERLVADFTMAIHLDPDDAALYRERGDA